MTIERGKKGAILYKPDWESKEGDDKGLLAERDRFAVVDTEPTAFKERFKRETIPR